ncbi:hypothetical protein D3C71_2065290 [compost metagenome]
MHGLRIDDRPEHVDRALVHMRHHAFDVGLGQLVVAQCLLQRVGGRMRVAARCMELE